MSNLADAVRDERLRRKWSVRHAAGQTKGTLSNTWWQRFEDRLQPLTPTIQRGVAIAFEWDDDWPQRFSPAAERHVPMELAVEGFEELRQLTDRVVRLEADVAALKKRRGRASGE